MSKLTELAYLCDTSVDELLVEATFDSVAPGICINDDCSYVCEVEPDQDKGFCEECGTQTVASCLCLAGML